MSTSTTKLSYEQIPWPVTHVEVPSPTTTARTEQTGCHLICASFRTVPGVVKIVCLVFTLLGFTIPQFGAIYGGHLPLFFFLVNLTVFWVTFLFWLMAGFSLSDHITWKRMEPYFFAGAAILLGISTITLITNGTNLYVDMATEFCGSMAVYAYGYYAFLMYRVLRTIPTVVT